MSNEHLNNVLDSRPIKYRYARTQREYLNLIEDEVFYQARWDFEKYISLIFGSDKPAADREEYQFEFFHKVLIHDLFKLLFTDEFDKLMFLLPPRSGKSELGSILIPTYLAGLMAYRVILAGRKTPYEIIQSSYADSLLKKFIAKQMTYVESNQWKRIFPQVRVAPKGGRFGSQFVRTSTNMDFIADVSNSIFKETGGNYKKVAGIWSVPLQGPVTGMGADLIILDDMVKGIAEADSFRIRENTWNWWNSTLSTRLEDRHGQKGKILALNTRWHEDDITARLEAGGDWKVVRFPAFSYPENHKLRDPRDPRKESEVLSRRLENRFLEQKKKLSKRHYSALYQQLAVPLEGNIIKGRDLRFYREPPKDVDIKVMSIDLAFKGLKREVEEAAKAELSYSVFEIWGVDIKSGHFYLMDQRRGRYNYPEQRSILLDFVDQNPDLQSVLVEDATNAQALFAELGEKILNLELVPPRESKSLRLRLVEHLYQQNRVFYPDPDIWEWVNQNIEEITNFPAHKYKDTVDVASQALHKLDKMLSENKAMDSLTNW